MRSILSLVSILLFVGLITQHETKAAEETRHPNVLLICIDDLKPNLGCYGDKIAKTPGIDGLAQRGVLFQNAYCNQAVCSPSRNALLTSLRPQTLGIYDLPTNFRVAVPNAVTMPQYFKHHGYHAAALGKIYHVGHGNTNDVASWSVPHFTGNTGMYQLPENKEMLKKMQAELKAQGKRMDSGPRGPSIENADVPDEAYNDGKVANEAIARLNTAAQTPDQPFFLAVGFVRPHLPFVAPKKYWDMYQRSEFKLPALQMAPEGAPTYAGTNSGELRQYSDINAKGPIPLEKGLELIHGYYAATSYTDAQIQKVLDALDANKQTDNTIILLWGDHGWHLGDHGQWCKHTNYEQAAHIPLIVSYPRTLPQGQKTLAMVETVDVYPTLAELAGLNAPEGVEGQSFVPSLKSPSTLARPHVVHVYPRGQLLGRAIRNERYRLVEWRKFGAPFDTAEWEFYDYEADPLESRNLYDPQNPQVQVLKAELQALPEPKPQIKNTKANPTPKAKNKKPNANKAKPQQAEPTAK
jgi:iduronate 2-sulfatase